ncbi:hypothetical protein [Aeromicrobium sp.]|uniref:hypothetical protein n=1 Tax=Aeromicrobium sp. TaxID=1871063 RepID=UPI002FCC834E
MARVTGNDTLRVEGIKELNAALRKFGDDFKGEMRRTLKPIADMVAEDARGAATSLGSTAAHVAPTIKASAGAQFAAITLGDPAAAGAEFGGRGRPTTQQFQPWRGNGENAGYFVWPTIRKDGPLIDEKAAEGLGRLIEKAGLA